MTTYGDFFTGGGGMTLGALAAGLDVVFGVEYDEKIAAVYRQNIGDHIIVADLTEYDVTQLPRVDVFHASPPCTNASVANANAGESPTDLALSLAVCRYITAKLPDIVTLENVYQYRKFESWHQIARTLLAEGYTYSYWHVNMADYGVPQTRKRMIVVARRDGVLPELPPKTHAENPTPGLFGTKSRWVSWYEAIEDTMDLLIPDEFPPYAKHLRSYADEGMHTYTLSPNGNSKQYSSEHRLRSPYEPYFTITANKGKSEKRRVVIDGGEFIFHQDHIKTFSSFPQWYDCGNAEWVIGNAVPPLFAEKLYKELVR